MKAFRTLDSEHKGFIPAEVLEELLSSNESKFRSKELESFLLVSKDPETGNIYYEDYVALLTKNHS